MSAAKHSEVPAAVETVVESRFDDLIALIEAAKARIWSKVNAELVQLYWEIGKYLSKRTAEAKWGDKVIDGAAEYLRVKRPDLQNFTRRTLFRMREFYDAYKADEIVSPLVTQITWTNHLVIMQRAKTPEERRFYVNMCISERYSKRQLERQFDTSSRSAYVRSPRLQWRPRKFPSSLMTRRKNREIFRSA